MKRKRSKQAQIDVVKRDGRCMWCGRIDETLVGHHISSFGASGDDSPENMITLCARCHDTVGRGYLDARVCNHPRLLRGRMGAMSRTGEDWKVWKVSDLLREILHEHYP